MKQFSKNVVKSIRFFPVSINSTAVMFTRDQLSDLQTIIQETMSELIKDDTFFKALVTNIHPI